MSLAPRRSLVATALVVTVVLFLAACVSGTTSPVASATASAGAVPSPTPVTPASPSTSAAACVPEPQTIGLPSDRLVDVAVTPGTTSDLLTFIFGDASLPGPAAPPVGTLETAPPPYTMAGSGVPIQIEGAHIVAIRFTGMSLQNDAGQETYTGLPEVTPRLPALRHAVMFDASEGVLGWYLGYDGSGCVTPSRAGQNVTVTIAHA